MRPAPPRTRRRCAGLVVVSLLAAACMPQTGPMDLEPAPQLQPGPGETYLSLGKSMLATNEPALAMRAFTASMSTEGMTAEAVTGAGIAARRQGLVTAARRYFEKARELAPRSATVHNNLGVVLFELEEYHAARSAFRTAMELSGEGDQAARENLLRAEAALARGRGEAAEYPGTPRIVRLGTDRFRITEGTVPETEAEAEAD